MLLQVRKICVGGTDKGLRFPPLNLHICSHHYQAGACKRFCWAIDELLSHFLQNFSDSVPISKLLYLYILESARWLAFYKFVVTHRSQCHRERELQRPLQHLFSQFLG